jgi:hypothetical protein
LGNATVSIEILAQFEIVHSCLKHELPIILATYHELQSGLQKGSWMPFTNNANPFS